MKTKSAAQESDLSPERDFIADRVFCPFKIYAGAVKN